jgi:hypothetical protein
MWGGNNCRDLKDHNNELKNVEDSHQGEPIKEAGCLKTVVRTMLD